MAEMKILVVTNMYPGSNEKNATQGIFVDEQVHSLRELQRGVVDVCLIEGFRSRLAYVSSMARIVNAVRKGRYDIVHYHFGLSACSVPLVKWLTKAKTVVTFHGSDVMGGAVLRRISLVAARFADACIAVNDEIAGHVATASNNCHVIPCAVNEKHFVESMCSEKCQHDSMTVVFPSSPGRVEKDYPLFKEVLKVLRRGDWPELTERHIDGLDRDGVRDLLDTADCLLLTSHREGSPQSVKEAMAMNLPVVTVDVGDVDVLLGKSDSGTVVGDRDPANLAREVARVLKRGRRTEGRERLKDLGYFSSDVAERLWLLYRTLLGEVTTNHEVVLEPRGEV